MAKKPSHGLPVGSTDPARRGASVLPARTWAKPCSRIVHTSAVKKQKILKKLCHAQALSLSLV